MCRQHAGYARRREALIEKLGGLCVTCGTCFTLQFDHKDDDRKWVCRDAGRLTRIAHYERESLEGKLQLLCRKCNARKSALVTNAKIRARKRLEDLGVNFLEELDSQVFKE